jgi:hypothetical protein
MEIKFNLGPELVYELELALGECTEQDEFKIDSNQFALQCLECILAERRLSRIAEATDVY